MNVPVSLPGMKEVEQFVTGIGGLPGDDARICCSEIVLWRIVGQQ